MEARSLLVRLPAEPASVTAARGAVSEYVRSLGVAEAHIDAVQIGVSEAVSNTVLHAYPEADGVVEIEVGVNDDQVEVVVRDEGCGRESALPETAGAGFGTLLIETVSQAFELKDLSPRGTEVRMTFPLA